MTTDLIDQKKKMKKRKPKFLRQEFLRKRLKKVWRRPKGIHSKIRERRAGKPARVNAGYGTPKKLRDRNRHGFEYVRVSKLEDLSKITSNQLALIEKIGNKKKQQILREIIKKNIKVSNLDPKKYLEDYEQKLKDKKEKKAERAKKQAERKKIIKSKEEKKQEEKKPVEQPTEEKKKEKTKPKPETQSEQSSAAPRTEGATEPKEEKKEEKKTEVKIDEKVKSAEKASSQNK